jgi:hypothetical protein
MSASVERPWPVCPLVVAYRLGVDSTAMLIEFARRGIRPDLILFADTGGEKPETSQYPDVIRTFLARVGFPDVIVARYQPRRAACRTPEQQCMNAPICFGVSDRSAQSPEESIGQQVLQQGRRLVQLRPVMTA